VSSDDSNKIEKNVILQRVIATLRQQLPAWVVQAADKKVVGDLLDDDAAAAQAGKGGRLSNDGRGKDSGTGDLPRELTVLQCCARRTLFTLRVKDLVNRGRSESVQRSSVHH